MLYLVALVLPPLAVLLCGKPLQAVLSIVLTLIGLIPGQVHAVLVVHNYYEDRRLERIEEAIRQTGAGRPSSGTPARPALPPGTSA